MLKHTFVQEHKITLSLPGDPTHATTRANTVRSGRQSLVSPRRSVPALTVSVML